MRKLDGTLLPQSSGCDAVREDKTLLQFAEAKRRTFHSFEFLPSCWTSRVGSSVYNLSPTKELNPPTDVVVVLFSHEQSPCLPSPVFSISLCASLRTRSASVKLEEANEQGRGMRRFFRPPPLVSNLRLKPLSEPFSGCAIEATKEND